MLTVGHMPEGRFYDALPVDMKNASDTLANTAVEKIARLFAIEKQIETLSPDKKAKNTSRKIKAIS